MRDPYWLLNSQPREVQIEALRRSYQGRSLYNNREQAEAKEGQPERIGAPFQTGWSHYMEMRLGKTPTVLNEFELFKQEHDMNRCIAICPPTFRGGWVEESLKSKTSVPWFTYESSNVNKLRGELAAAKGRFGLAVNYEALKTDSWLELADEILDKSVYLAIDESVKIKNHKSLQTRHVLDVAKRCGVVRNLSGLPMVQGPQDLYPQFRAIRRLEGMNFFAYRGKICKLGGFKGRKITGIKDEEAQARLDGWLAQSAFVAKRRDWANPFEPEYIAEHLNLSKVQRKHYDMMDKEMVTFLDDGEEVSAEVVVSKLMKLQQISSGFIYTEDGKAALLEDPKKTAKMERLIAMREETDRKMIVCYHYSQTGDVLLDVFKDYAPAVIRSRGWMAKESLDVDAEKRRFNNSKDCRMMFLQISAGKYGHDLSGCEGDRCEVMAFYENTYSLDDRNQIEMRNTSAFQDWTNTIHDFMSSQVERNAVKALVAKEDLVEAVFGAYKDSSHRLSQ